ncbi:ParB/RepB/Spo0J family partition protein [Nocardioides daphniae]|uniref:ParB-like N-terminal domain-containing protein n=2 Tax=Nocardioides daphniae TaxID=402297 RepID=A0A4P7UB90_9ACTN|nr:ParB/RepB/Spo0J family partition protein [Nocardioides daphniae]QCC77422.1 hypothetical protein E2C04_09925 [Nocardioides daphniae]GGD24418.1 hypothetical protein GCM10007231_24480 [Nocardioides daphniae]
MSEHDGHIELERSVNSIRVGARHRHHPDEGVESLMASIKNLGLLQPITITPDGVLVCGARRLAAIKQLGWRTVKVWVRSGISDDLSRLLAQQDENTERKELTPREQAALFTELRRLMSEDAARRQEASRFGANTTVTDGAEPGDAGGVPGAAESAAPRGHLTSRHQAALEVTGKASYSLLEQISKIERVAADRSLPETLRRLAEAELEAIDDGAAVNPAYQRLLAAHDLLAVGNARPGPSTPTEKDQLDNKAADTFVPHSQKRARIARGPGTSRRSLRAFVLTWSDLDGWSRFYDPREIAAQLSAENWQMFERVLAETITFADEVRTLRAARVSA